MRPMRALSAGLLVALVLVGCGGVNLGAGEDSAAELVKPGALVYWEVESDPDSDQWQQAEELIRRFPDGAKWLAQLREELESDTEVTWEEVRDVLGGTTAIVVYAASTTDVKVVGLTHPDDPDELIELVQRINAEEEDDLLTREVDGWVALSDEEASFDAALKGESGQALSDDQDFEDGMAELPDDALTRVYVDVAAALETLGGAEPQSAQVFRMLGLDDLDFAGAWAKAREDGAELAGALRGEGADKLLGAEDEYSSELLELVPADAFAAYTFQGAGTTAALQSLRGSPLYGTALREFEQEAGVKLEDIAELFRGEVLFYAAPGSPIPELTLLTDAEDPAQARQSADRILRSLAQRYGGEVTEDGDVTTAAFPGFTVNVGTAENTVVITTTKDAIAGLSDAGEKLVDTDRYQDALEVADAPEEYTTLLYLDLKETVDLVMGFASFSGETVPPELSRNLEPLRSVVAYGQKDGDLGKALLFVEIGE
ncbi:MAG TPA: hypothetical protein VF236_08790 [Gaiellaceae bacterium]